MIPIDRATMIAAASLLALVACRDATAPETVDYTIRVEDGDAQFVAQHDTLRDPLEVLVEDDDGNPVEGLPIVWRIAEGSGARILAPATATDSNGIAATFVRFGNELGSYRVVALTDPLMGHSASFRATVIEAPVIESIRPASVDAGDTLEILGRNFADMPAGNLVVFGGFRGMVIGASPTRLEVRVPPCIPTGAVPVTVLLNGVAGASAALGVNGGTRSPLGLAVGEVRRLDAASLACIELAAASLSREYLLVLQNAASVPDRDMHYQLAGLAGGGGTSIAGREAGAAAASPMRTPQLRFERGLRRLERRIVDRSSIRAGRGGAGPEPWAAGSAAAPQVGDQDTFFVCNDGICDGDDAFTTVTARVEYVSDHAVFYQDVNAPANGFTQADFEGFGSLFDDIIYDTNVGAFGEPSDIDGNDHIIILFTPVVNSLTEEGSSGFIAGFFFGLDLINSVRPPDQQLDNSNEAEIFYSLVPDPEGEYSDARSVETIRATVPPVLAHEFQHMIAFNQRALIRGGSQNPLWLSEGLAHMAEDLVGDTLEARGFDFSRVERFKAPNFIRSYFYLETPSETSLINEDSPGTLEQRGAAWLFLKYLAGHYGGAGFLKGLVQTMTAGVTSVEAETGVEWQRLMNGWSIALWADNPEGPFDPPVNPVFTYTNLDLRAAMEKWLSPDPTQTLNFPLNPSRTSFEDLVQSGLLPSSSPHYLIFAGSVPPYALNFAGRYGGGFIPGAAPQIGILRIE